MILVDTSVWIDFLQVGNPHLESYLRDGKVVTHPFVVGALSVGNVSKRAYFLNLMKELPQVIEASHNEVGQFIENHEIYGKGIGYFDAHLLCSAIIGRVWLWTLDKRLQALSDRLNPVH